jgi:hypothetical protein
MILRLTQSRWAALSGGTATAILVAIAVFALGAPPWILIPASWAGITAFAEMRSWADRRLGRR